MRIRTCLLIVFISFEVWAHPGTGIVEDSKGNIFYTDLSQVFRIDATGKKIIAVPHVHTHELFIDKDDNLFGEHLWYNGDTRNTWSFYVWKLSPQGAVTKIVPDREGFRDDYGYSFVQDHLGNMFIPDRTTDCQKVIRKSENKKQSHSSACFHNIRNMKTMRDGNLIVVDFQDVVRVNQAGQVKTIAAKIADKNWTTSSTENQNSVMGVWDDKQGNIYAAVSHNREVVKFAPDGKQQVIRKAAFPWAPSGGLISSQGELWVLEASVTNAVRVVQIGTSGKLKVY